MNTAATLPAGDDNVARAARLETSAIADALDKHGIVGQCYQIRPLDPSTQMAGRAWTLRYRPASNPPGTVGDFLDDVPPGSVVVLDAGGRENCTVWGDIATIVSLQRGISGVVIDGMLRDTVVCRQMSFPTYSKGVWMRTGKDRLEVDAMEVPVKIGDALVTPGDIMRGDADGVVVIPRAHEDAVLDTAEKLAAAEAKIIEGVRAGKRLDEVRKEMGYHKLQSRQ